MNADGGLTGRQHTLWATATTAPNRRWRNALSGDLFLLIWFNLYGTYWFALPVLTATPIRLDGRNLVDDCICNIITTFRPSA